MEEEGEEKEREWKKLSLWTPETRNSYRQRGPANARYKSVVGMPLNMCIRYLCFSAIPS